MAKTKTFGVRLTPELISELERLKGAFSFTNYGETIESWVRLRQNIDEGIGRIAEHPREWKAQEVEQHLFCDDKHPVDYFSHVDDLTWRRLRERFGEDGLQHIRELVAELHAKKKKREETACRGSARRQQN